MATQLSTSLPDSYTLILCGNSYDESVATIFATGLRKAGHCVKIVGMGGTQAIGACGITLQADLAEDEIWSFAGKTRCIMLPCDECECRQLIKNQYVRSFFAEMDRSLAPGDKELLFVVHQQMKSLTSFFPDPCLNANVLFYPPEEGIFAFTRTIAEYLCRPCNGHRRTPFTLRRDLLPGHVQGFVYP